MGLFLSNTAVLLYAHVMSSVAKSNLTYLAAQPR